MKNNRKLSVLAIIFGLSVSSFANAEVRDQIEKTFNVSSGATFAIDNINGAVKIEAWDKEQISVVADITADTQESRDKIEVEMIERGNGVSVETHYKKTKQWNKNNNGSVEYTIMVPSDTRLSDIELVNGALTIEGVAGEIEANLVNGAIVATGLTSDSEFNSVNGSIKVSYASLASDINEISLNTVNGSIKLAVPSHLDATVNAETMHGSIKNDFGLSAKKNMFSGRSLSGSIGDGSIDIELESVNGSIKLLENN